MRCPIHDRALRFFSGRWGLHVGAGCTVELAGDPLTSLVVNRLSLLLIAGGLGLAELVGETLASLIEADRLSGSGKHSTNQGCSSNSKG